MSRSISTHLDRRFERLEAENRASGLAMSLGMHLAIIAFAWFASTWSTAPVMIDDFSQVVRLVPVAALGTREVQPKPTPPAPRQEAVPELEEPAAEETEIEEPVPTLSPPPERRKPTPSPAPTTRSRSSSQPQQSTQRAGSPTGSLLGTSLAGSGAASLDSPDFTYSYYTDQLLAQIDSVWNRPVIGGEIEAIVKFVIRQDGSLANVSLARSSGYNSFDLAAMRAIRAAAPFPPLPAAFRNSTLGVNLTVR